MILCGLKHVGILSVIYKYIRKNTIFWLKAVNCLPIVHGTNNVVGNFVFGVTSSFNDCPQYYQASTCASGPSSPTNKPHIPAQKAQRP